MRNAAMFLRWYIAVPKEEREDMNGDTKRSLVLGAIALGVGVALGAILNDKTKESFVDSSRGYINRILDEIKGFARNNPAKRTQRVRQTRRGRRRRVLHPQP